MPITTTVITQQSYNLTVTSSSVALKVTTGANKGQILTDPATGLPITNLSITTSMNTTDASTTGYTCTLAVNGSWDGGKTFQATNVPLYQWTGGIGPKGNFTIPGETGIALTALQDANGNYPDHIQIVLDTQGHTLNMGVTVSLQS